MSDHDDQVPVLLDGAARARLRHARAWLRVYVRWWGFRTAGKKLGCSTEAVARFLAGFPVRKATVERIERQAQLEREAQEARRAIGEVMRRHRQTPDATRASSPAPEPAARDQQGSI